MKKVLLGTSAIALAGALATPASAAEWDVDVGGFMEAWVGFGSTDVDNPAAGADSDVDGLDAKSDGEIIFAPSITLDNGIKFGAVVELEARQGGDQIDEQYVYVRGSFGEVIIGDENSAGYKMTYAAPDVSFLGINSGSATAFVAFSGSVSGVAVGGDIFRGTLGSTYIENDRNNDAGRLTYFTPRFSGFQLGASYARDNTQDTTGMIDVSGATSADIFDIGANYVNSFGDIDVAISGRYGYATNNAGGDDPEIWGAGFNLGYSGFTIGGSFAEQNGTTARDGTVFDAGVSYRTGPWGFSFTYLSGENVDNENAALGADETLDIYQVAVDYDLAKGVDLNLVGGFVDFDEDLGDGGATNGGNDVEGFYVTTGLRLRF